MRRSIAVVVLGLCGTLAGRAEAQGQVYPVRRTFGVLSEALATGQGGVLDNGTTFMHTMRGSLVTRLVGTHGLDLTAVRLQTIRRSQSRLTDLEHSNPEGDALILSYAALNRTRAGGIPNEFAIGGGVIRRNTSEPGRTRDTWVARLGYDADPFSRFTEHMDATVAFHIYLMQGQGKSAVYVAALGIALRGG